MNRTKVTFAFLALACLAGAASAQFVGSVTYANLPACNGTRQTVLVTDADSPSALGDGGGLFKVLANCPAGTSWAAAKLSTGTGAAVASATALPIPTGSVFHVTGTTTITSVLATNFSAGDVVTLIFDGILTFTDGSNLKIAGNMTTSADDTITLAFDGTNWYEVARSVN
jgi:hypothetical protein